MIIVLNEPIVLNGVSYREGQIITVKNDFPKQLIRRIVKKTMIKKVLKKDNWKEKVDKIKEKEKDKIKEIIK